MGIEEDIQQYQFRNDWQKAMINLIYTHSWLMERMKAILHQEDITTQQFNILRILRGSKTVLSTLQIRERMLDRMSDTSRIVDRLVIKGLVKKSICKTDKRLVDVQITAKGMLLLKRMDDKQLEMDAILSNITAGEAATLSNLLDKLRN